MIRTHHKQLLSAVAIVIALLVSSAHAQSVVLLDNFEVNYDGWTYNDPHVTLKANAAARYQGMRGMSVSGRKAAEDGASSNKVFYVESGQNYNYSVYVKHAGKSAETFNLTAEWVMPDKKTIGSKVIATSVVQPNTWARLSASFATPEGSFRPTFTITTNSTIDFYFDEFEIRGRSMGLAKSAAPTGTSAIPADVGLKDVYAKHFRVGNILNSGTANNTGIQNLFKLDYNSVTAENEHKPYATMEKQGSSNTNIRATLRSSAAINAFCANNNIPLRGHVLTWHGQSPDWFFIQNINDERAERDVGNNRRYRNISVNEVPWASKDVMNQRLESYIKNLFELFKEEYPSLHIWAYDVTNEAFDGDGKMRPAGFDHDGAGGGVQNPSGSGSSPWQAIYGNDNTDWIRNAFTYARRWAPAHTKLYYNDFNEWQVPAHNPNGGKRGGIIDRVLKPYLEAGILDGMGMQSHVSANPNDGWSGESAHLGSMEIYANVHVGTGNNRRYIEVQCTELDPNTDGGRYASTQPQRYANIFKKALEINQGNIGKFTGIIIWTPNDANTWIGSQNSPALHNAQNQRKPAYDAVAGLVPQSDWGDGDNPTFGTGEGIVTPPPPPPPPPEITEPDANGFFFYNMFEDGTTEGWSGRYCCGGDAVFNTTEQKGNGSRSLAVTGRQETWQGVVRELSTAAFVPGKSYSFSTLAMYLDGDATEEFKLTMSYNLGGEANYVKIDSLVAERGKWVRLANSSFPIPAGATDITVYVEMPSTTADFFIDDIMGGIEWAVKLPDANGYLFHHTFEGSETQGWEPRFGAGTTATTSAQKANGQRSLLMSGRTEDYHGPVYSLSTAAFVPGSEYSFSVLAMYAEGPATASFKFTLQYSLEGETVYSQVALRENVAKGSWVVLENQNFDLPVGASNLVLYVEMPDNPTTSFYIDDVMGGIAGAVAPGKGVTQIGGPSTVVVNSARPLVSIRGRMLNISSPNNSALSVRMIDIRGKTVARYNVGANTARQQSFSLKKIPAGRYFVDVRGAGVRQTLPVVVK